ncbi:MAG: PhoH family protein [Ectothiorhodospiraceae bacterium]|nr:PhoH family protein [Ectothiorhodospiraceae bacterium]
MSVLPPPSRRIFVLDTSVLMHDPSAVLRFREHDVYLPLAVLEELDAAKKGLSEVARNARQATRSLEALIGPAGDDAIAAGIPLPGVADARGAPPGRLRFEIPQPTPDGLPPSAAGTADNRILQAAIALGRRTTDATVVLVSKDINLRLKARVLGLPTEDYREDEDVPDDLDLLYRGTVELDPTRRTAIARTAGGDHLLPELARGLHPNQFLVDPETDATDAALVVRAVDHTGATLAPVVDYGAAGRSVWGIAARNREQNFALNLLMDPTIDFVTLLGTAGTGKTLLALAAGLAQVLDKNRFREIIMTRVTVPVGEDIGFLPGTEEEKMTPWMGALMDNLEVLTQTEGGEWGRAATDDLLRSRIRIHSLNFMRGRTFLNKYIILDEAQNLTPKQMKTLITRAGPGTKIVCLGNVAQIDTPYLTETTSGLTYVVDRFKNWPHGGHITLLRGERSRLADFASEAL